MRLPPPTRTAKQRVVRVVPRTTVTVGIAPVQRPVRQRGQRIKYLSRRMLIFGENPRLSRGTRPIPKKRRDKLPQTQHPEKHEQWSRRDSNPRHLACKASALPTELRPQRRRQETGFRGQGRLCSLYPVSCVPFPQTVGAPRLELGTSALSGPRSNQLSYAPGERVNRLWAIGSPGVKNASETAHSAES